MPFANIHSKSWLYILLSIVFVQCIEDESSDEALGSQNILSIPMGFPPVSFPDDNPFTDAGYDLGKALFFDPILSADSSISCASCHIPNRAFSDRFTVSTGANNGIGTRNTPSLANVAYHPYFTREGGVPTLEMQVLVPIQEHNEFNFNIVLIAERLQSIPKYVEMSKKAYGRLPDAFCITRSIANFERTLISGNSAFDKYFNQGIETALTDSEKNGMDLFFSDSLACGTCHGGFDFTDYSFQNNGLYESYADSGRMRLTGLESDRALFKVPSLRNVALTEPYMHDGSLISLYDVIDHYQNGGENHINKSPKIIGFELSAEEVSDLIAFLESLNDYDFINNPNHQDN